MKSKKNYEIRMLEANGRYYYDFPSDITGKKKRIYGESKKEVESLIEEVMTSRKRIASPILSDCILQYISLISDSSYKQKIKYAEIVNQNKEYLSADIHDEKEIIKGLENIYSRYLSDYSELVLFLTKNTLSTFTDDSYDLPSPEKKTKTALDLKYISDVKNHLLNQISDKKTPSAYIALWLMLEHCLSLEDVISLQLKDLDMEKGTITLREKEYKIERSVLNQMDFKGLPESPLLDLKEYAYASILRIYKKACMDCGYDNYSIAKVQKYTKENTEKCKEYEIKEENLAEKDPPEEKPVFGKGRIIELLSTYKNLDIDFVKNFYLNNKDSFSPEDRKNIESWLFLMEIKNLS